MVSPRVTIVTPSFNQAGFLEETILSVLEQDYPNIEYMVIDGGSTDSSVDIIQKYASRLAYWVSEPDRGQSHAINKGWSRASGQILAWINSDDYYTSGAVARAIDGLSREPGAALVYSDCRLLRHPTMESSIYHVGKRDMLSLLTKGPLPQPTVFLPREIIDKTGLLDESLHLSMDYDLWLRAARWGPLAYLQGDVLAVFRQHTAAKGDGYPLRWADENERVLNRLLRDAPGMRPAVQSYRARFAYSCMMSQLTKHKYREAARWWLSGVRAKPALIPRAHIEKILHAARLS